MSGSPWIDTVLFLLVIGVPVALVLWYLRSPYDEGSVPRDALASRGKSKVIAPGLFVWPTKAYRSSLIDTADDASHEGEHRDSAEAEDCDTNDFADTAEHRAQVVKHLRQSR